MSLNKPFNANEIHGLDFGEMIMASQSKAKFVDWKEIRVFSVAKSGMYIAFRVGSKKIVQIVCHETDEHETPRFERMALSEDANPIEGWTTTMIWKYKHGKVSTVKELADGLRGFDDEEMKGWKISEDEEQYPLVKILTKKAIHELVLHCELREEQLRATNAGGGIRRSGRVQEHDHGNAKAVVREGVLGLGRRRRRQRTEAQTR